MTGEDWQQWAVPGAAWLLTYLIHSTLLIAAVWLVSRRLEGRPAALEALWKTALVGGLVTATLQTAAGVSPWGGRLALVAGSPSAAPIAVAAAGETAVPAAPSKVDAPIARPSADARAAAEPRAAELPAAPSRAGRPPARDGAAEPAARSAPESAAASSALEPPASSDASAASARSSSAASVASSARSEVSSARSEVSSARSEVSSARSEVSSAPVAAAASAPAAVSSALVSPRVLLTAGFLAWAALAALLATGLIRSWLRLRRLLADRRPIESGPAARLLGALTLVSSLRRRIRLSASTRVDVPIAVGVLRPEIVVPERALYQLDAAELESLLAHELAHLVRRDPLWRVLAGCFHRVLFVQPLNRIATAQLESASEVLCDDWAVERTDHPLALARCLTEVAGWVSTPLGASVPAMARSGSGLGRRVRRLVAAGEGGSPRRRDRWPIPLACGALALVVFAAPGAGETGGSSSLSAMPPRAAVTPISTEQPQPAAGPLAPLDQGSRPEASTAPRAPLSAPSRPASPPVDKMAEARRLLAELRSGTASQHDIASWVALAQVLGSGHGGARALLASSGDADDSAGGPPLFAGQDFEDALAAALSHALGGLDVGFELDADGGFEIHLGDIHIDRDDDEGDDEADRDQDGFDLDLELPDIEIPDIEVPDLEDLADLDDLEDLQDLHMHAPPPSPPGTPSPPPPPDCEHGFPSEAVHEMQRQALEVARQATEQAREAIAQGRRAREQALRQAHDARRAARHALRQAARDRANALAQAGQARDQALRDAERAREHALRDAERAREHALARAKEAIQRAREVREELRRQAEQRRRDRDQL